MEPQSIDEQLRQAFFDALGELLPEREIISIKDEMGSKQMNAQYIAGCLDVLIVRYGLSLGRGLAVRAGRIAFRYGLRYLEPLEEMKALSYRLMPVEEKIKRSLDIFACILSPCLIESISIREEEDRYIWRNGVGAGCPMGRIAWVHGFVQEGLYWQSNGKYYPIKEVVEEQAEPKECILLIPKKALE